MVSDPVVITVSGTPAPQGSKRHVGRGVMIESSAAVLPWREAVKAAALQRRTATLTQPVSVSAAFYLKRPKSHYGTGRNRFLVRPSAPPRPGGKPDLDKVLRATFDALTDAGVWLDDAQAVDVTAGKWWAELGQNPGAIIHVTEVTA